MRRPRFLVALLTMFLLVASILPSAGASDQWALSSQGLTKVNITMDGRPMDFSGYIVNDRTVAPLRAIFEALSVEIKWDPDTRTVTATKGSKVIVLTVGQTGATIDGKPYQIAVPPVLIDSRTFVPVRFIVDALGLDVKWDANTYTVIINSGTACALSPFQRHEGTISPGGETWGQCGSPHIVSGEFKVEGKDSPILTIEPGTVVRFEEGARIVVGNSDPGGFVVNGTTADRALFTADSSGPQPGFWNGIYFGNQTLINDSRIKGAKFEYAGDPEGGAITIEGYGKMVEVQLNDVEITNSQYAGLNLKYQGRLRTGSAGLKISNTMATDREGGFPIVTAIYGSHNLPRGEFKENAVNAVHLFENGASAATIAANTTWRNVSIPYAIAQNIYVEGDASPTLTVDQGTILLFGPDTGIIVGWHKPGTLIADATAKPEGGGEWKADWNPDTWTAQAATNEDLTRLGTSAALEPGCALCGKNGAIVFGAWTSTPDRGAWNGVQIGTHTGDKTRLVGTMIAYGGNGNDFNAGLYAEANDGRTVKFLLAKSIITGAARSGMEFFGNVQLRPESTGNAFVNNGWPLRVAPDQVGFIPPGQSFAKNDKQVISISTTGGSSANLTRTATWRNHGIPYALDLTVYIGGTSSPKLTIEAGSTLLFSRDTSLVVGSSDGAGTLEAVGAAGKPIKFTSEAARAGAWDGLHFTADAGAGNRLEMVQIEYANIAVSIDEDLGGFIKNTTIRSSKEMGIYRGWGTEGTSFVTGLANQFEGNALDENQE